MLLPSALYTGDQVRALDRRAIEVAGISGPTLMERAAVAVYRAVRFRWPRARRIAVLCGPGNNGGDGRVLARLLQEGGLDAVVDPPLFGGMNPPAAPGKALRAAPPSGSGSGLASFDLIVDALLGTGLKSAPTPDFAQRIASINASGRPVLSVDIPSGLSSDTGAATGAVVRAALTVTFIGLKLGLFTGAGRRCAGTVLFDDLDCPAEVFAGIAPAAYRLDSHPFTQSRVPRVRDAHKGHFGTVLVIGGNRGMSGAAALAGRAALRAGAGRVFVAVHPESVASVAVGAPELMVQGVMEGRVPASLIREATVVVAGPGLGRDDWAATAMARVLEVRQPIVLDADGLWGLAADVKTPAMRRDAWIMTPHPGEAARLLGLTNASEVEADRPLAARLLQERYGGVAVLKGAGTLIASSDRLAVCDRGNPGMATAGTGDVLAGVVGGLVAQGIALREAAECGVWLHALAGDRAAGCGEIGLVASDLLDELPRLRHELRDRHDA